MYIEVVHCGGLDYKAYCSNSKTKWLKKGDKSYFVVLHGYTKIMVLNKFGTTIGKKKSYMDSKLLKVGSKIECEVLVKKIKSSNSLFVKHCGIIYPTFLSGCDDTECLLIETTVEEKKSA